MGKILTLLDGSIYTSSVCDHAIWAAKRMDQPVELAHVLGHRQGGPSDLSGNIGLGARTKLMDELAQLDADRAKLGQLRGRAILEDSAERVSKAGVAVESKLRQGDLVAEIGVLSEDADLIIIGKRGEAADFARGHLGSNLERVVRSCNKPILVAARDYQKINRAVIAFDGGPSSLKAVDHIARSPMFEGIELHLLMVGADAVENHRTLDGAASLLKGAGYEVDIELVQGDPADEINSRIQDGGADMLVMGAYGHSRIRSLIIGSTTTEMIRRCGVSLVLFR
ncbi:MAG: universal stress protein [Pseudomonadota bacterium]